MDFSKDHFSACLNQSFRLMASSSPVEQLTLIRVDEHPEQMNRIGPEAYSVVLQGPPGQVLPRNLYRLSHEEHGKFDLFIAPVGQDEWGVRYEAVFA